MEKGKEKGKGKGKGKDKDKVKEDKEERPPRQPLPPVPRRENTEVSIFRLIARYFFYHWRGYVGLVTPIITVYNYYPAQSNYDNVAMCAIIMIVYWVTECIPLQVTSFLPIAIMPITRCMDTHPVCMCYFDDTVILYMASIMLGSAVEFSGLARRIALNSFKYFGLSHCKILLTLCFTTMFISMWITNTAATLIMMPILKPILEVYELQGEFKVYEENKNGVLVATSLTICHYCSITFAATIGGIGTLFGTATNFVGKALFISEYPTAPELLTIKDFSFFSIPIMLALNTCMYFYMAIMYMGMFRPFSKAHEAAQLSEDAMQHGRVIIQNILTELGPMTGYEYIIIVMFFFSMGVFILRSPEYFTGWGDYIQKTLKLKGNKYILDSVAAIFICFVLIMLPCPKKARKLFHKPRHREYFLNNYIYCTNISSITLQWLSESITVPESEHKEQYRDEMKERRSGQQQSRLLVTWDHMSGQLPWSYIFVLGGGLALATSCREQFSNTNEVIVEKIKNATFFDQFINESASRSSTLIPIIIIATVFATLFVSNMVVAILGVIFVNNLAYYLETNPLWFVITVNFSASFCFMLPMGTPGNQIVHKDAKVSIFSMILAGLGPTIFSILFMWLAVTVYAPIIWPILKDDGVPTWVNRTA